MMLMLGITVTSGPVFLCFLERTDSSSGGALSVVKTVLVLFGAEFEFDRGGFEWWVVFEF